MSEFLAEAAVLIAADTRAFRTELAAALATVPKAIEIPIVGISTGSAASARRAAKQTAADLAVASGASATGLAAEKKAAEEAGAALQGHESNLRKNAAASKVWSTRAAEVRKGFVAQAASAAGLRGAIIGANSAFILATAGAIALGKALSSAAQFQTEMATFAATTGATADQMEQVSIAAKQLGADITLPAVNAQDAAVAMTELAKAGLSVQDSIDGARGVLQLATAAQIDNAAATELAASALNAFGLAGGDAVHVADVLANASNDAQGSITDIGIALQQASAAGRQAGFSLEETAGILTIFARNGIKGSDAGTLLRTMLIRLINPTNKAQEVMDKLGLHIRDATGGINLGFFDEFARKTAKLTAAERDRDAAIIAGQDAFRGLSILAREGGVAIDNQVTSLNKAGTASDLAAARTAGLAGAVENLKNQIATASLSFGSALAPALTNIANLVADAIQGAQTLGDQLEALRSEAAKPIDFVINFIPGTGGGDGGDGGVRKAAGDFLSKITSIGPTAIPKQAGAATKATLDFRDALLESTAALEDLSGVDLVTFPTVKQATKDVHDLINELNKAPTPTNFNETVVALQDMQKRMADGTGETKVFADALTPFIARLQKLSTSNVQIPEIKFPSLVPGATDAAKKGGTAFQNTFLPSIKETFGGAANAGWAAFQAAGARGAADAAKAAAAAIASATSGIGRGVNQQAGLDDVMNQILLGGGTPQQQISNLNKQFAVQQGIVDKAAEGLKGLTSGDKGFATLIKAQREARAKQVAIQGQITTIQGQMASDAQAAASAREQKAQEAAAALAKSDQAVLDSFTGAQNRIDLAQIDANATKRLSDDIAVQRLIANTASREIAVIEKTVKDVKTRNAAIAARVQTLKAAGAELDRLRKEQADAAAGRAQSAREAATATLEKKLQLAQIIGKKDPILKAFDALIANERKSLAAAKKADKLDALIKLQQTIKDRKDFLESLKKDAEDANKNATTAFDLLSQFSQVFNQNAGNLIGGNQPFAGPTGFTADIAQFLIRRQPPPTATTTARPTTDKLVTSNQALVDAINRLRDSFEGSVPGPVSAFPNVTVPAGTARKWHRANTFAREFQES